MVGRGLRAAGPALAVVALLAACGDDSNGDSSGNGDVPSIVVTTNILGDVATEVVGEDSATIETIMPPGVDPHEFEPAPRQAEAMMDADLLVVNGVEFEEGLLDLIDQAEAAGVEVFTFADHMNLLETGDDGHDHEDEESHEEGDGHVDHGEGEHRGDHGEDAHGHEEHEEQDDGHEHGPEDPHIWTDPSRMAGGVEALGEAVTQLDGIDPGAVQDQAAAYAQELRDLDGEIESLLAGIPEDQRVLVTNHEVFGYFADRYGFEVVGTVIPTSSTQAEPSGAQLDDLADTIRDYDVPAIFADTSTSTDLADRLAGSVGDIEVVQLYSESLGDEGSGAESYVGMMRTNATLIASALA